MPKQTPKNPTQIRVNRGGSRIYFRTLQNFTKKKLNIEMMKYAEKLLIQQEARRYRFDYNRGADLKVKFDSSKKHPQYGV